jgi:ABC-type amino acid transport substrate-binding protein
VDAVVLDAAVLLYVAKDDKGRMQMVGAPFRKEAYGIVFPRNDPLRKQPNIALCALREAAIYQPLSDKWLAAK